ncbi:MAG: 4Fe-4S binding protein [Candidatus Cloacimonas sp.]|nr:4Fe-4S binding protein [Candidatus Cloacimonadota bacterium]
MRINFESCDLCGTCVSVCPVDAIEISEYRAIIDREKCTNCGLCLKVCPAQAIVKE